MTESQVGEIIDGLWRFEAIHPEWTEEESGEDGWEPLVAWWAAEIPQGLVLIDPLVEDWADLDRLVGERGCAGIVRTCHWHQRSIAQAADRYGVDVWARVPDDALSEHPPDHHLVGGEELFEAVHVVDVERGDEVALWLPRQAALICGDVMIRRSDGDLRVCPDSWTQPEGGSVRLRELLRGLLDLPVEHVLVSHGPFVLGGGSEALRAATS